MARDFYETTIALPDANGHVVALTGVKVSVVPRGASDVAGSLVDIFVADTGVSERTNPIVTTAGGVVRFWADGPAEYDIVFEDTEVPARVADRIGWNAVPAKAGEPGTPALVPPGTITQAMLGPSVVNNEVPIGVVLDWWRPADSVDPPLGFVMCLGQQILKADHDFPVAGNINAPDLRNVFILGADEAKADGTGAAGTYSDAVGDAPGIRGSGGSNAVALARAEMPAHNHGGLTGSHNHTGRTGNDTPAHTHNYSFVREGLVLLGVGGEFTLYSRQFGDPLANGTTGPNAPHQHDIAAQQASIPWGGGKTEGANDTTVAHNNMPKWVGLLKIMKVKR